MRSLESNEKTLLAPTKRRRSFFVLERYRVSRGMDPAQPRKHVKWFVCDFDDGIGISSFMLLPTDHCLTDLKPSSHARRASWNRAFYLPFYLITINREQVRLVSKKTEVPLVSPWQMWGNLTLW